MRRSIIYLAAVSTSVCCASAAFADVLTLRQGLNGYTGTRDDAAKKDGSYAYENLDDNLYAYSPIYGSFLGAVVGFNLSSIPANATINSASLQMTFSSANFLNGNENAWDIKNPSAQWIEGQVSFHFAQNTGAGVKWEPTDDPFGNFNASTGIQMVNQPIVASNYISGTNNTGVPLSFDVTSMVSGWVTGGQENRGFAIVHERGDPAGHIEWAGKANPNATWRPTLTIDYTPVIPGWKSQSGDWNDSANWTDGVPNAIDAVANFKSSITAARTVYADIATTAGTLNFDNANSYVISGAGSLSLQVSSGSAAMNVVTGNHKINLPLTIVSNTNLNVSAGASLKISDPVTVNAGKSLASIGSGTVTYESTVTLQSGASLSLTSSQHLAGLTIGNNATATLASGGGNNRVLVADSLSIGSGKVDLKDNKMIFKSQNAGSWTGSSYTGATGLVQSGRNGGSWTGSGIVTSSASGNLTTLGVATAAQAKGIGALATTVWAGQTVSGSDTLVMYTYGGDANLDGKINVDDYTRIDFNVPLGTNGWFNGDFNYDGKINVDDYTIIDFNVGIQGAPISSTVEAGGLTAVPEPASMSLLAIGAAALLGRRKRGASTIR